MGASMQGELQPNVYRFKFGNFEIANILDGKVIRDGLHPSFGPERPATEAESLCRKNGIEANRYVHPFIPTLVNTGRELILFDTGNGGLSRDYPQLSGRLSEGGLVGGLAQAGYKPSDVDIVVITHGHPDHIGGLMEGGKPVFANARYVFGAAEFDFWKRGENVREARKFNLQLFQKLALPLEDRARFIKPGDEIAAGIRAVDAAGHSPGMLAYHVESGGKRFLIWADTCVHYVMAIQRPDWHLDVDDDKDKAAATRRRILAFAADDRLFVTGYHMPFPGIGTIEVTADGHRWVPVSYQLDL
ncbi:MAG TPA: MBL fold metallo-hydrolase [Xanthobacteraceae bacterium]|nr:MBL fold metallo-hydrolase [Xanthobacteraceae bacterium]